MISYAWDGMAEFMVVGNGDLIPHSMAESFKKQLIKTLWVCVCLLFCMCTSIPGTGVTGSCELPNIGVGKNKQMLKSAESFLRPHLSPPRYTSKTKLK